MCELSISEDYRDVHSVQYFSVSAAAARRIFNLALTKKLIDELFILHIIVWPTWLGNHSHLFFCIGTEPYKRPFSKMAAQKACGHGNLLVGLQ